MTDIDGLIEARLHRLEEALQSIEQRLGALEEVDPARGGDGQPFSIHQEVDREAPTNDRATPGDVKGDLTRLPNLIGRTFLVFCGAFLLRALTEAGTLLPVIGAALGLGYGLIWMALSYRSALRSERLSGLFYGISAVVIGYPLLFEATTRYGAIPTNLAITSLVALTVVSLAVAAMSQQRVLAWAVIVAAMVVIVALLVSTHRIGELAIATLVLGIASLWISERCSWHAIRWPVAVVADLMVLQMTSSLTRQGGPPEVFSHLRPDLVIAIALGLVVVYAGGLALGTLRHRRAIQPFEVAQTAVVILVGFGGAFRLASMYSIGAGALLAAELIVAAICYAVAFAFVDRRLGRGPNFIFFTSVAIALMIHGLYQTGPTQLAVIVLWCLALITAILGGLFDRITLRAHAALYLTTAAGFSGWLGSSAAVVFTNGTEAEPFQFGFLGAAIATTVVYLVLVATRRRLDGRWWSRLPAACAALIAAIGWGALAIQGLAAALLIVTGTESSTAIARMVVVSLAAVFAATVARHPRFAELAWLCPLILVFGGARLLLVDVWNQPPGVLVVSFAFFGAALILSPRILRSRASGEAVSL